MTTIKGQSTPILSAKKSSRSSSVDDALIASIYRASTSEPAFQAVLEQLAWRFRCLSAVLIYVDPKRPSADFALAHGVFADAEVQARYRADFMQDDPAPAAMAALKLGQAIATDRIFTPIVKANSRFVRDYYHPLGLRETLGGPIVADGQRFGLVAVHRGADRTPFDDNEIADFERLLPHIIAAAELRQSFFAIESRATKLEHALDGTTGGVILIDSTGRLSHGNSAARTILGRSDVLLLDRFGRVKAVAQDEDEALQRCLLPHAPIDGATILRLGKRDGVPGLILAIRRRSSQCVDGLSIHLSEPLRRGDDVAIPLARAFGLRKPAARLVMALVNGDDLSTYAARSALSINTVKSHLATAFASLGCQRQVDLVRIATTVMGELGLKT